MEEEPCCYASEDMAGSSALTCRLLVVAGKQRPPLRLVAPNHQTGKSPTPLKTQHRDQFRHLNIRFCRTTFK